MIRFPRRRAVRPLLAVALAIGMAGSATAGERASWATRSYHSTDGLPSNVINDITQDLEGFLWLATDVGLVRFDGQQFETWGSAGEPALPAVLAESVLASRDRSLWVGLGRGLCQILPTRVVQCPQVLRDAFITALLEDRDGRIWAGTRRGVTRYAGGQWQALGVAEGLPGQVNVLNLLQTRDGHVWVSTAAGLFRCEGEPRRCSLIPGLDHQQVREDPTGVVWATDPRLGLRRVDPARPPGAAGAPVPRDLAIRSESLLADGAGNVWVGTPDQGVWVRPATAAAPWKLEVVLPVEESGESVQAMFEDRAGSIWIGTRAGLFRVFKPPVTMITRADGLAHNEVRALQVGPDGDVWVATRSRVHRFAGADPRRLLATYTAGDYGIRSLAFDRSGALLVGTGEGVYRVADGRFGPLHAPQPLGAVHAMVVDQTGALWLCHDAGASLSRWTGDTLERLSGVAGTAGKQCTGVPHVDRGGRVRVGFTDGTILVFDQGRFTTLSVRGAIAAMHEAADGSLWVATTRGLFRIRDGQTASITQQNGLPGDFFTSMVVDRSDALWLTLRAGIVRLRKPEFDRALANPGHKVEYQFFDSSDGLSDGPAKLGGPASVIDGAGRLWFQTLGGAAILDEAHAELPRQRARASIERVRVDDGTPLFRPVSAHIPPNPTRMQIDFTAVHLSDATKVRFRYKLEGFDHDWVEAGSRRQAFFTALPPGTYRFVLAARLNGVEQSTASLGFTVEPAFYQTRWFLILGVCLAAAIVAGGWQLRLRRIQSGFALVLDERTRISRELHDTILQALAGLALQVEGFAQQHPDSNAAAGLRRLRRQVEQHIHDTRHAILGLRSGDDTARPLAERLEASAVELLTGTGVRAEITVEGQPAGLPPQLEEQVMRIAQEAIRNAARHSGAALVQVTLRYGAAGLVLTVRDEGKGFTPDEEAGRHSQRWGVMGMQERARKAGAGFTLESAPGLGTTVTVTVPDGKGGAA